MIIKYRVQNFKVDVMHSPCLLPVLHTSLPIATKLESGLTKKAEQLKARLGNGSPFGLRWKAFNTFKSDNKKDK